MALLMWFIMGYFLFATEYSFCMLFVSGIQQVFHRFQSTNHHACAHISCQTEGYPRLNACLFYILMLIAYQVAAGGTHSVVLTRDGHVWTWGQPWPPGDMYVSYLCLFVEPLSLSL